MQAGSPIFIIQFRDTNLSFFAHNMDSSHSFYCRFTRYAPGFRAIPEDYFPTSGTVTFDKVRQGFLQWLEKEVRTAIEEELLPDLWSRASSGVLKDADFTSRDTPEFTEEERQQIKLAISNFRLLMIEQFSPTNEQLEVVEGHLEYLRTAVDRLNRFDWRNVTVSTLIGIATALSLDTEKGRQLYGLFQQAFSALMHLIK